MRVLELSLRNYRVFEEVDLELPARVIGVFGPNGGGKSTLMESIAYALYGWSRTPKQHIRTHGLLTDCEVRLVFEHAGNQYEVRRLIRGKNHATDAELLVRGATLAVGVSEVDGEIRRLLRMDQQVFRASAFAEQKQLDAFSDLTKTRRKEMVLRLLGIKPVDDARAMARARGRELKGDAERLAAGLPDLAALEAEAEVAREAAREAEIAADEARRALDEAESRAAAAEEAFAESERLRARVEAVAGLLEQARNEAGRVAARAQENERRLAHARERLAEAPALRDEREALGDAAARLDAARDAARAAAELARVERQLEPLVAVEANAVLAELEAASSELDRARDAAARAAARAERSEEELAAARAMLASAGELDPSHPCPTCGQRLGAGFERVVVHYRTEAERLESEVRAARDEATAAARALRAAESVFAAAQKAGQAVHSALARRDDLTARQADLRAEVDAMLEPFGGSLPDIAELEARAERSRALEAALAAIAAEERLLADLERDRAALAEEELTRRTRIEELEAEAASLAFEPEEHERRAKEREESRVLLGSARENERAAAAVAKDAASAVAAIRGRLDQARETAERATGLRHDARYHERVAVLLDGFRDHLVSRIGPELSREAEALFRELTNHEYEDLRISDEDLAIEIADAGTYFDVSRFSGSEADLANLALRVAISIHLSRVSGADVGMMVLDEVLGALDAERRDLMVQAMGKLERRFHQLFVVTHAEQVKDQFPASLEVRKVGRRRSEAVLV